MLIVLEPLDQKYHVICFGLAISLEKQLQNLKKKKNPPNLQNLAILQESNRFKKIIIHVSIIAKMQSILRMET